MKTSKDEILDLNLKLRSESLLVSGEKENLKQLNISVKNCRSNLQHLIWIQRQQQLHLSKLIYTDPDATPKTACRRANGLEKAKFVESFRRLSSNEALVGELCSILINNPQFYARLLNHGENFGGHIFKDMVQLAYSCVYGSCVLTRDERLVLELLGELIELQLVPSPNPRVMLRKGSCAFSRLYRLFSEGLYSARLFLTAALHEPIMNVLSHDDYFLDIDPSMTADRFTPQKRLRLFGDENSPEYKTRVAQQRVRVVKTLSTMTRKFIDSLKLQIHCLPACLSWLLRQLYRSLLANRSDVSKNDVHLICTDLLLTGFICPAITQPEPLGIIADVPISHVARFNLMQCGQILQTLAIRRYESADPKLNDIYSKFSSDCVSSLVDQLLLVESQGLNELYPSDNVSDLGQPSVASRSALLITHDDLNKLLEFLKAVEGHNVTSSESKHAVRTALNNVMKRLPEKFATPATSPANGGGSSIPSPQRSPTAQRKKRPTLPRVNSRKLLSPDSNFPDFTPLVSFVNGHADSAQRQQNSDADCSLASFIPEVLVVPLSGSDEPPVGFFTEEKVLEQARQDKRRLQVPPAGSGTVPNGGTGTVGNALGKRTRFSLSRDLESVATSVDNLELLSNQSVCSSTELEANFATVDSASMMNDNLSDMVSGRGTPSISGRDTPLSMHRDHPEMLGNNVVVGADDVDELVGPNEAVEVGTDDTDQAGSQNEPGEEVDDDDDDDATDADVPSSRSGIPPAQRPLPNFPVTAEKENRQDIEEKFGRFEIPQSQRNRALRDESHSVVSDAWSTDVWASESDYGFYVEANAAQLPDIVPGGQPEFPRLDLIAEEGAAAAAAGPATPPANADDNHSDTWSVDALASDSEMETQKNDERLTELDFEDAANNEMDPDIQAVLLAEAVAARASEELLGSDTPPELPNEAYSEAQPESTEKTIVWPPHQSTEKPIVWPPHEPDPNSEAHSSMAMDDFMSRKGGGDLCEASPRPTGPNISNLSSSVQLPSDMHGNGAKSELRRQSSGSSFYSKSDVESEFSGRGVVDDSLFLDVSTNPSIHTSAMEKTPTSGLTISGDTPSTIKAEASNNRLQVSSPVKTRTAHQFVGHKLSNIHSKSQITTTGPSKHTSRDNSNVGPNVIPKSPLKPTRTPVWTQEDDRPGKKGISKTFQKLFTKKDKVRRSQTDNRLVDLAKSPHEMSNQVLSGTPPERSMVPSASSGAISEGFGSLQSYVPRTQFVESCDDIMDKYRTPKKPVVVPPSQNTPVVTENTAASGTAAVPLIDFNSPSDSSTPGKMDSAVVVATPPEPAPAPPVLYYDPQNVSACPAFQDAKRKLRLVLSAVDFQSFGGGLADCNTGAIMKPPVQMSKDSLNNAQSTGAPQQHELVQLLQVFLAEAINAQDKTLTAQLRETLRCLQLFDNKGLRKLLRGLREDHRRRAAYISYLQYSKLKLLQNKAFLEKLVHRIERDEILCCECMVEVCVRLFFEQRESEYINFLSEFQKLQLQDEKSEWVQKFLDSILTVMERDEFWKGANDEQLDRAQLSIERLVMTKIYSPAMFPNEAGDHARDDVIFEHIKRLAEVVSLDHKDVRIPVEFHAEAPWPAAQREIGLLNAYKSPRDKVHCILRCCENIQYLLGLHGIPAADDLVPVLVFVVIQANPPHLLSTIEYVKGFYEAHLKGEQAYFWTQFCSAVEFIKTLDYQSDK